MCNTTLGNNIIYIIYIILNILGCFSVIWDTTHKGLISFMFKTVDSYKDYLKHDDNYYLDYEDIFDFLYLIMVFSMLWTWTFTCKEKFIEIHFLIALIIESYA